MTRLLGLWSPSNRHQRNRAKKLTSELHPKSYSDLKGNHVQTPSMTKAFMTVVQADMRLCSKIMNSCIQADKAKAGCDQRVASKGVNFKDSIRLEAYT